MKRNLSTQKLGWLCVCASAWVGGLASPGSAQTIDANASLTGVPLGLNFDYTLTLDNTPSSTSQIETFWYAWVPGEDFLPTSPLTVSPPSGWTYFITGGGLNDGYAIEFTTSSAPLNPGGSLGFTFTSADTPAELAGDSPAHPGTPVGTSVLYGGAAFSSPAASIVVQPVPEPSTFGLLAVGGLVLARRGFRGARSP